jgi:predicted nucleic acid-binding protein
VIYVDSSVLLSRAFAEEVSPPDAFWDLPLTSSRLLLYEVWVRVHVQPTRLSHREDIERLLDHVELIGLSDDALDRALHPLPLPLRTLDALHLATMHFLRRHGQEITLASYDQRLLAAASATGISAEAL